MEAHCSKKDFSHFSIPCSHSHVKTETNPYAKLRLEVLLKLRKLANSGTYSASQLFLHAEHIIPLESKIPRG